MPFLSDIQGVRSMSPTQFVDCARGPVVDCSRRAESTASNSLNFRRGRSSFEGRRPWSERLAGRRAQAVFHWSKDNSVGATGCAISLREIAQMTTIKNTSRAKLTFCRSVSGANEWIEDQTTLRLRQREIRRRSGPQ